LSGSASLQEIAHELVVVVDSRLAAAGTVVGREDHEHAAAVGRLPQKPLIGL
jgi:hypothetical protein